MKKKIKGNLVFIDVSYFTVRYCKVMIFESSNRNLVMTYLINNIRTIIMPITLLLFIFDFDSCFICSNVPIYNVAAIIPIKIYSNAEADK